MYRLREPTRRFLNSPWSTRLGLGGLCVAGGLAGWDVYADAEQLPPMEVHWSFTLWRDMFDTASLRRGYEVYRQVCSSCHSMKHVHFRHLVGVTHTKDQAKALAANFEYEDGPNDEGEMFMRKGKLTDPFPPPYKNKLAARAANGGALPPDMSCLSKSRHHGPNYIFAILTGYNKEPPFGWNKPNTLYYNPYFDGGAIAMRPPLSDGQIKYEDGTPATVSQMAKDVCEFLEWCSYPEMDERKRVGFQLQGVFIALACIAAYHKRFAWASLKTRRISWIDVKPKK